MTNGSGMLNTYYTYRALASEWDDQLAGDSLAGVYSSRKKEITVELASGSAIVFGVRKSLRYLFRSERTGRPRRNVAVLMEEAHGAVVRGVRVADRDRVLSIDLTNDLELRYFLFGSRPNVLLLRAGRVVDAHKGARRLEDESAPPPRPAHVVQDASDFVQRARKATTAVRAVTSAFPLFDSVLAKEALFRAGMGTNVSVEEALESGLALFESARGIERSLEVSEGGRIYKPDRGEVTLSLIPLEHLASSEQEVFESVDSAVSVCSRMMLRRMQYEEEIGPVRAVLDDRLQRAERRLREVTQHLESPGRADELERMGHLLMASGRGDEVGLESIRVPDHFAGGNPVEIRLDPALSVVENAGQYYDRARRSRASRQSAADRMGRARNEVNALQRMASELEGVVDIDGLRAFKKSHEALLVGSQAGAEPSSRPFRRYVLGGGFEVWVGRNAKENDELTFGHARKFDIWMHARGVSGSHAVLRLPGRGVKPGSAILEAAAAVAAYFSKARGSELVPVMYTERKYVRKPRGADGGKVIVEREEVVIVRPALPGP